MQKKLKIGLTLILIGTLILSLGYIMLDDFREREEDTDRIHPEETILEQGSILALNFCGIVFLGAGMILLIVKILGIKLKGEKNASTDESEGKV